MFIITAISLRDSALIMISDRVCEASSSLESYPGY